MGGCVDPRALLDLLEQKKALASTGIRIPELSTPSLLVIVITISRFPI
jgi:hypothetical protein